jgi:hypothetical protein
MVRIASTTASKQSLGVIGVFDIHDVTITAAIAKETARIGV